jgi:hypothetical protein
VATPGGSRTVSLDSPTTEDRRVIRITRFDPEAPTRPGPVTITVTSSAGKVLIDGLLVAGWGDGRP